MPLTFRQRHIIRPLMNFARRRLPRLSDTEREALEAGTLGFEAGLLAGQPDYKALLALPHQKLTPAEQAFLDGPVEALIHSASDWDITHTHRDIPPRTWEILKRERFFAMLIPREYGGLGFSATAAAAAVMKVASHSPSLAVTLIVPNSLGPSELLQLFGTEHQRQHWLPRLASAEEIPAFGLTSETAGSDATSLTDHGTVTRENGMLGIRLNWSKRYISLAPVATVLGLAFRLNDPERLLSENETPGLTLALAPTQTEGVSIGRRHYPGLLAFPNGPTQGENVFIPVENIIGGAQGAGHGWAMLVTALAAGRGIMLPAMALAAVKSSAFSAGAYARIRRQFNIPVAEFEGIAEPLAKIAIEATGLEALRQATLDHIAEGGRPALLSAMLKHASTEGARRAVNAAMDIHGGKAIMEGPSNWLGSAYRALPIAITVEGANILTRSLMVYGQGALRCHPYLRAEAALAAQAETPQSIDEFGHLLGRHARWLAGRWLTAVWHNWTGALFAESPVKGPPARHFRHLTRLSATLACISEAALLTQGGKLKRMEMLSGRFADALTSLAITAATLRENTDTTLTSATAAHHLARAERKLAQILRHFPSRLLGLYLRLHVLPFRWCRPPSDATRKTLATLLSHPGEPRNRLTQGIATTTALKPLADVFAAAATNAPDAPAKIARAISVDDFANLKSQD